MIGQLLDVLELDTHGVFLLRYGLHSSLVVEVPQVLNDLTLLGVQEPTTLLRLPIIGSRARLCTHHLGLAESVLVGSECAGAVTLNLDDDGGFIHISLHSRVAQWLADLIGA